MSRCCIADISLKWHFWGPRLPKEVGAPIKKKVQLKRQPTKNKTKINKTKINRSSETLMALDNKSSSLKANTNEIKTVLLLFLLSLLLLLLLECLDNHGHWWLVSNSLIFSIPPVPYSELCYITHTISRSMALSYEKGSLCNSISDAVKSTLYFG